MAAASGLTAFRTMYAMPDSSSTDRHGLPAASRPWLPVVMLFVAATALIAVVAVSYWAIAREAPEANLIPRRVVISEDLTGDPRGDVQLLGATEPDDRFDLVELYGALLPGELEVRLTVAEPIPQGVSGDDQSILFLVWVGKGGVSTHTTIHIENTSEGAWTALLQGAHDVEGVDVPLDPPDVDGRTVTAHVPIDLLPSADRWRLAARSLAAVAGSEEDGNWGWLDDLPKEVHSPTDDWLLLHP